MISNLDNKTYGFDRGKPRLNLRNLGLAAVISTALVTSGIVCKSLLNKPNYVVSIEDIQGETQETLISKAEDYLKKAYKNSKEPNSVLDPDWKRVSNDLTKVLTYLTMASANDPTSQEILDKANMIEIDAILQEVPPGISVQTPYGHLKILKRTKKVQGPYDAPVCKVIGEINGAVFSVDTANNDYTLEQLVNLANQQ